VVADTDELGHEATAECRERPAKSETTCDTLRVGDIRSTSKEEI